MRTSEAIATQLPIESKTKKFISWYKFGGRNIRIKAVTLFNWTRKDADRDSGRGNMVSARAS